MIENRQSLTSASELAATRGVNNSYVTSRLHYERRPDTSINGKEGDKRRNTNGIVTLKMFQWLKSRAEQGTDTEIGRARGLLAASYQEGFQRCEGIFFKEASKVS